MNKKEQLVQALRENLRQLLFIKCLHKREVNILNLICQGLST
ncbi:hypothetical protein [uncultured Pontibacter sp.]|nr:hypothetical protein [uncultured Pontibacter sp.]